jgi:hypothetical protein
MSSPSLIFAKVQANSVKFSATRGSDVSIGSVYYIRETKTAFRPFFPIRGVSHQSVSGAFTIHPSILCYSQADLRSSL